MFKVGDRVYHKGLDKYGVIDSISSRKFSPVIGVYFDEGYGQVVQKQFVVLEEIYNSPLYKALQEDNE